MYSACCQKCVIERGDCRRVVFHPVLALRVLGRIFRGLCDDSYVLETAIILGSAVQKYRLLCRHIHK